MKHSLNRAGFNALAKTLVVIAIIGALNWGLVGFFNFNLVDAIFGGGTREVTSGLSRIVYAIVGLAGLGALFLIPWGEGRRTAPNDTASRLPPMGRQAEVRP